LKEIASGGEMSRTMLALKTVLAKNDAIPILVFDEIDSGVSGPMGSVIGEKLKRLSQSHQIFCVTHLPQIACFAQEHIYVNKLTQSGRSYTLIEKLTDSRRVEEISRMLSGGKVTPITKKHAQELINQSK